jgi:hypothetical protein
MKTLYKKFITKDNTNIAFNHENSSHVNKKYSNMKAIIKNLIFKPKLILVLFFLTFNQLNSQGLVNNGAKLSILNDAKMHVLGNVSNQTSGVNSGVIFNEGDLIVSGNLTNTSTSNIEGLGIIELAGSSGTVSGTTETDYVTVSGNYSISAGAGNMLRVRKILKTMSGGNLNANGNLTLISNATNTAFIDDFTSGGTVSGNVNVQRYVTGGSGYRYLSSPINPSANLNVTDFGSFVTGANGFEYILSPDPSPFPTCWIYDETFPHENGQVGWISATNASNLLERGRGYAVILSGNNTVTLTGPVNTGSFSGIDVSNTLSPNPSIDGQNLIGNPYPSPILWTELWNLNNGTGPTDAALNGIMYRWISSGTYTGQYGQINSDGVTVNGMTNEIALGQAFMVKRNILGAGPIVYNNNIRTADADNPTFYDAPVFADLLRIKLVKGNSADETVIYFTENANDDYDADRDALKSLDQQSTLSNIYSLNSSNELAINAMGKFEHNQIIPLEVRAGSNGIHNIEIAGLSSFDPTALIILEDKTTNQMIDLRNQDNYAVTLNVGTHTGRFYLHFTAPLTIETFEETCHLNDGKIAIKNPSNGSWSATLKNSDGLTIFSEEVLSTEYLFTNLSSGNYTVDLVHESGYLAQKHFTITPSLHSLAQIEPFTQDHFLTYQEITVNVAQVTENASYQWFLNDLLLGMGETVNFAISDAGVYELRLVANTPTCDNEVNTTLIIQNTTSVNEVEKADFLRAFPNPANELVTIVWNEKTINYETVSITDLSGRTIKKIQLGGRTQGNQLQIDLKDLSEGMYLIAIEGKDVRKTVKVSVVK